MVSMDSSFELSIKIVAAMSDPTAFVFRGVGFTTDGSSKKSNGVIKEDDDDEENISLALILLEIATVSLRLKERLNIDMNEWKKPKAVTKTVADTSKSGSKNSKSGSKGAKGAKGAKGGKGGKGGKATKAVKKPAWMKNATKKPVSGTAKKSTATALTSTLGHHSHPLLMSLVASIGSGRSNREREAARRTIIRSIQNDPSLTSVILSTLRSDLRTRNITIRVTDDDITRDDRFQLASAYTSIVRCLVASPEILQSDNLGNGTFFEKLKM